MSDRSVAAKPDDQNTGAASGRDANSPWQMPARGWKQVAVRTWRQSSEDNVALVAAGVAFYSFLALVPLLGATVLTYGLVAAPETVLANVQSLAAVMPADAAKLIGEQLMSVVQSSGSKKGFGLVLALAIAIFGARNAAGSIITALNIA
jgi:membrane protein